MEPIEILGIPAEGLVERLLVLLVDRLGGEITFPREVIDRDAAGRKVTITLQPQESLSLKVESI